MSLYCRKNSLLLQGRESERSSARRAGFPTEVRCDRTPGLTLRFISCANLEHEESERHTKCLLLTCCDIDVEGSPPQPLHPCTLGTSAKSMVLLYKYVDYSPPPPPYSPFLYVLWICGSSRHRNHPDSGSSTSVAGWGFSGDGGDGGDGGGGRADRCPSRQGGARTG